MSQVPVKLVLLATSNGRADPAVPNALAAVGDVPILNYFMASIQNVVRLQPLKDKVFIVANERSHASLVAWASNTSVSGGFPLSNILNMRSSNASSNVTAEISFAVRTAGLDDCHLVIASLEVLYRPHFNFQRIVEHSIIRAKDTVVFHRPPPGQDLSQHIRLGFDDMSLGVPNPRVMAVDTNPSGPADGINTAVLAPMLVIRRGSLPEVLQASSSAVAEKPSPASCQVKQLGAVVQDRLLGSGKEVYALEEDWCMDISTPAGLAFADGFLRQQLSPEIAGEGLGSAARAVQEVTQAAQDLSIIPRGDRDMLALVDASSDTKKAFLAYVSGADMAASEAQAMLGRTGAGQLPERFADPSTRKHNPRQQNPMYLTTNNDYGFKKVTALEMPDTYAGATQKFTGTFYGGPAKVSSMVTAVTTSKVHKKLDDF